MLVLNSFGVLYLPNTVSDKHIVSKKLVFPFTHKNAGYDSVLNWNSNVLFQVQLCPFVPINPLCGAFKNIWKDKSEFLSCQPLPLRGGLTFKWCLKSSNFRNTQSFISPERRLLLSPSLSFDRLFQAVPRFPFIFYPL